MHGNALFMLSVRHKRVNPNLSSAPHGAIGCFMKSSKVDVRNERQSPLEHLLKLITRTPPWLVDPCSLRYCVLPEDMLKNKQVEKDRFKPKVSNI